MKFFLLFLGPLGSESKFQPLNLVPRVSPLSRERKRRDPGNEVVSHCDWKTRFWFLFEIFSKLLMSAFVTYF